MTTSHHCTVSPAEIRAERRRLGLKQAALAELLGVNQATVSRWERGQFPIEHETWTKLQSLGDRNSGSQGEPSCVEMVSMEGHWPALLKQFRFIRGLSQEQLAEFSGYTPESVSRWESGRFSPSLTAQSKLRDLILTPLGSNSQFDRLFKRICRAPGCMSMGWGVFIFASSPELRQAQERRGFRIHGAANLAEAYEGKLQPFLGNLNDNGFFKAEAPMAQGWIQYASNDRRCITGHSVRMADGNTMWIATHTPWSIQRANRNERLSVLHADELVA